MNDDSAQATLRTWTRSAAAKAKAHDPDNPASTAWAERPAGWIVRMHDGDGRAVAAGPSAGEAMALARELGSGEGRQASPATAAELDALDLPPWALGIAPDERHADPWWRAAERPVYRAVFGPESRTSPSPAAGTGRLPIGSMVHAWGQVDELDEANDVGAYGRDLGTGYLVGWLKRERAHKQLEGRYESIPYFAIAGCWHRATDRDDVALAVVEGPDGRYLPSYPRCPDCGGAVKWAEAELKFGPFQWAEAVQGPGSRECAGCGSRFIDTRYSHIDGRMPCPHCGGRGHVPRSVAGTENDEDWEGEE
ncbi:MAG: hypothetical protein OXI15_23720 [Chromatiales bacterium]|nr:hypothetical protein [Chromatiales bacterium]